MKVPFIDYSKLVTEYPEAEKKMLETLHSGRLILQKEVEEFEEAFGKFLGVKHVVGLNSGTDALLLALAAAGVGPGDEVITVSHTFIATIQVIHHLGATPVLVDVGEDGLMDMNLVRKAITNKTEAIIPVHLSGDVADLPILNSFIGTSITIIEDAAQAIGAKRYEFTAGTYSNSYSNGSGCFSFYPAKVLGAWGDAGALVTNNDEVAARVRELRNHCKDTMSEFGWNSRLDNIQAAVLTEKLKRLPEDLDMRRLIAHHYNEQLKDLPLKLPVNRPGRIWQDYIIQSDRRDELNKYLNEHGVGTLGADLIPNHLHPGLKLNFQLRNTEKIYKEQIRIPCNHFMTMEDAKYVADTIRSFYES